MDNKAIEKGEVGREEERERERKGGKEIILTRLE